MGRPPIGDKPMSAAERQRRYRQRNAPPEPEGPESPEAAAIRKLRHRLATAAAQIAGMAMTIDKLRHQKPLMTAQQHTALLKCVHPDNSASIQTRNEMSRFLIENKGRLTGIESSRPRQPLKGRKKP